MKRLQHWTRAEVERVRTMRKEGITLDDIAAALNRTHQSVRSLVMRENIGRTPRVRNRVWTEDMLTKAREMRERGEYWYVIAEELEVPTTALRRKFGLDGRS
jgi:orotate phosphoribosyltransferase-like protein